MPPTRWSSRLLLAAPFAAGCLAATSPLRAQGAPPDTTAAVVPATTPPSSETVPSPAPAPEAATRRGPAVSRLTFHGYLTQAWAVSSGVQFYGITDRPSADFRYAALQARFAPTPADLLLLQVNHRRLGHSPITDFESEVNLNWAFYQHTFRDATTLKVGRIAIPRGIYNELRSVGIALPMYRPPVVTYDEGAYFSETIDGVVVSRTFAEDRPWRVEAHAYFGGWRSLLYDTWSAEYSVSRANAKDAVGAQLWLETPIEGVRAGLAAQQFRYSGSALGTFKMKEWQLSLDASRERGFLRSEVVLQDYGSDKLWAGYVQLGARVTQRLALTLEAQRSRDTEVTYGDGALPRSFDWHRSDGVGLSYTITPTLQLKAEHHWDRGIQLEQTGDPRDPPRFRYVIVGLSAGF